MLTSSPIAPPRSTSASPRGFHHYAPNRSPQQSQRATAPLPRRQSKNSIPLSPSGISGGPPLKSPSQPKPKQYVGVDVATQYSPMEPFDPSVPLQGVETFASTTQPTVATNTEVASYSNSHSAIAEPPPPEPSLSPNRTENAQSAVNPVSPKKRRISQDLVKDTAATASIVTQSQTSSPKRSKPTQGPPKILPLRYELCDVEDMVVLISNMLAELIETNDSIALKSGHLTRFHSRTAPGISVLDYLHRLAKHATLTPPLLLSMVYYIDRLCALYPDFTINNLTVHRFLITAATVAGKGLSDSFWNNSFYARVGGVKVAELKLLELEFLYRVDWRIVPNPEVLVAYYKGLVERCPGYALQVEISSEPEPEESDELDEDDSLSDDNEDEKG